MTIQCLTSPVQAFVQSARDIINTNTGFPNQRGDTSTWDSVKTSLDGLTYFIYAPTANGYKDRDGNEKTFTQMMRNVLTTGVIQAPIDMNWFNRNLNSPFPPI